MNIFKSGPPTFTPITLVLETQEDFDLLLSALNWATNKNKYIGLRTMELSAQERAYQDLGQRLVAIRNK